jgi:integrase
MSKKLTKRVVETICAPSQGQYFTWDGELKGFGIRITPTRKTYVAQGKANGKTIRTTIGSCEVFTLEQARVEAKHRLLEMSQGVASNKRIKKDKVQSVTLEEAYQAYIKSRPFSDNTLRDYSKAMRLGFKDWASKPILNIKPNMVIQRFDELSKRSQAQTNQMFRFLRAVLDFSKNKYATENEPLFTHNPCDCLTSLNKWYSVKRRTRHLEPNQLKPWLEALQPNEMDTLHKRTAKVFCIFIVLTGCRDQEAAKLRWDDVDFDKKTITFKQTKNGRTHILPIGNELISHLMLQKEAGSKSKFVFPADNKHGHLKYHHKTVASIAKQCGIQFTLHDLRRTFASIVSHQLGKIFSAYILKRLLNHSSGNDVTAGYVQCGIEDLREPMRMVENFVLNNSRSTAFKVTD